MSHSKPFKIVIVGGSVAGLSLANMLQANNIDFVVLEAYSNIAPQVGASIGILPHGNRVFDQLGLFEKVLELSTPVDRFFFRDNKGRAIVSHSNVHYSFLQRHGFPILFLDRQMVLQIMYDNIKDKSKILTDKRVSKVEINDNCATAFTADGSAYTGDIVVGADGIYSTVRDEMWRFGYELEPGLFDPEEGERVPSDYNCIFGISKSCPGVNAGDMNSVFRDKASYLVIGGAEGRVYWFRFEKYAQRLYGTDIPRYTKVDAERAVTAALHEDINEEVKFSTLIEKRITSSMTALHEHVFKRWHFRRLITIGDSCHKFHPIGGHGGNAAIMTAAALTNFLVDDLKKSATGHLNASQIGDIFRRVHDARLESAKGSMDYSHEQQRVESLDTPTRRIKSLYLLPLIDKEDVTYNFSCHIPNGIKLEMLPVQRQKRLIPYEDELLRHPIDRGGYQWLLVAAYILCSAGAYYGMCVLPVGWDLDSQVQEIMKTSTFPPDPSFGLLHKYTGSRSIDFVLVFLTIFFMPGLRGWGESFRIFEIYFLGLLVQPIAIWTIESCRQRNALTLLAIPSIWFTLFQMNGIGVLMPLYYAVYTWTSRAKFYWWPLNRMVPIYYAKSILPATLIGYVLPTILMFYQWSSPAAAQWAEVFWQPSPLYVPILTLIFGTVLSWLKLAEDDKNLSAKKEPADIIPLKIVYVVTGMLGFVLHWAVIFHVLVSRNISLGSVFVSEFANGPKALGHGVHNIFLADFWGFFLASYIWCVSSVWDLKRVGRTNLDVFKAALMIFGAQFALGPGASMSAVWYWREESMATGIFTEVRGRVNGA